MIRQTIGGVLDLRAMADLAGGDARQRAFRLLPHQQQVEAVRSLIDSGLTEYDAGEITGWNVAAIRRAMGERGRT